MTKPRVIVVDDSKTMQLLIAKALQASLDIQVVGFASNAHEAREAIKQLDPDVITLDIEMPEMNGLDFLERLMRLRPTPVVMVSSNTMSGADSTMQALALGAVGCVAKPGIGDAVPFAGLAELVKEAAQMKSKMARVTPNAAQASAKHEEYRSDGRIVAIGSSAGGIEALSAVLADFPANGPPVVLTQHMPAHFTRSLAARLDRLCHATVKEATDGSLLLPGTVYVAPGGSAHLEIAGTDRLHCRLRERPPVSGHRPSVDVLFESVAKVAGAKAVGVILSGMGRDGTAGLLSMRGAGANTIGQDEATSFIYGMPRSAFEAGAVERQLPLGKIQQAILATTMLQPGQTTCR